MFADERVVFETCAHPLEVFLGHVVLHAPDESLAAQHRRHVRVSATLCCRTEIVLSGDILGADGQVPQGAAAQGELALLTTS